MKVKECRTKRRGVKEKGANGGREKGEKAYGVGKRIKKGGGGRRGERERGRRGEGGKRKKGR